MKTLIGFMSAAVLMLALGLAGPASAEICDRELPSCIEVITLTEKKVSFQNRCSYKVVVHLEVIGGYGGGAVRTHPNGGLFVYDETTMYPKPGQEAKYSQELKCCPDVDGYLCEEVY